MSEFDNTPVVHEVNEADEAPEAALETDTEVADETVDDPEIPVNDAVEQHTPVVVEDGEDEEVFTKAPDHVDPADATEQRRKVGHPEEEDYR